MIPFIYVNRVLIYCILKIHGHAMQLYVDDTVMGLYVLH